MGLSENKVRNPMDDNHVPYSSGPRSGFSMVFHRIPHFQTHPYARQSVLEATPRQDGAIDFEEFCALINA